VRAPLDQALWSQWLPTTNSGRGALSFPRTVAGILWAPYVKYAEVDHLYSRASYEAFMAGTDGFNVTQSALNLVEVALLGLWALYSALGQRGAALLGLWALYAALGQRGAALLALISCAMTASKTVLYLAQDGLSGWKHSAHNSPSDFWLLYILPSSLWIVFPTLIVATIVSRLWREL
jgi:hypothetical protein